MIKLRNFLLILFFYSTVSGCSSLFGANFYLDELSDNPLYANPQYKEYVQGIRKKIGATAAQYSRASSGAGQVFLIFELNSKGKLMTVRVDPEKTTASEALIEEATAALKRSSPFPPFPEGFGKQRDVLDFNVILAYE